MRRAEALTTWSSGDFRVADCTLIGPLRVGQHLSFFGRAGTVVFTAPDDTAIVRLGDGVCYQIHVSDQSTDGGVDAAVARGCNETGGYR